MNQSRDIKEFYERREKWIVCSQPQPPQVLPFKSYNLYEPGPEPMPKVVIEVCRQVAIYRLREVGIMDPPKDMVEHFAYAIQRKGAALFLFQEGSLLTTLERVRKSDPWAILPEPID